MNAVKFARLSDLGKLEHLARTKRVTVRYQPGLYGHDKGCRAFLRGVAIGKLEPSKQAALKAGKKLLTKYQTEAREKGLIPS